MLTSEPAKVSGQGGFTLIEVLRQPRQDPPGQMVDSGQGGFTLIEVLIAIAIFAVISLGANQVLRTVMDANKRISGASSQYIELNLALALLGRDLNQFTARKVRDGEGESRLSLVLNEDNIAIEFTRRGWANPAGMPRSNLQRLAWTLDHQEGTLKRLFWKVLDRASDSEPVARVMLSGVTDLRIQPILPDEDDADALSTFSDFDQSALQDDDDEEILPVAVEVHLTTEALGEVMRVFQLVDSYEKVVVDSAGGSGDG